MTHDEQARALADAIAARAGQGRFIVGLAGAPGSGKSTLAANTAALTKGRVVPMDGFHLDNAVLETRGLLPRKGAPETFDAAGFVHLLHRLRGSGEIAIPVFDREADLARAGAEIIAEGDRLLIVEGNYLLLDRPPWRDLASLFDLTVFLSVPEWELERRLIRRWRRFGYDAEAAKAKAVGNDVQNARLVARHSVEADITLRWHRRRRAAPSSGATPEPR